MDKTCLRINFVSTNNLGGEEHNVDWQQLLQRLQQLVGPGQVTTYGNCSHWAFNHRNGGPAVAAMLEAVANNGQEVLSNRVIQDDGGVAAAPALAHGQQLQLQQEGIPFNPQGRVDWAQITPVVL
jgi:alkylated DNA nucleotide flippase Atl1